MLIFSDYEREIYVEIFAQNHDNAYTIPPLNIRSTIDNHINDTNDNPFGDDTNEQIPEASQYDDSKAKKAKELSISILIILAFVKKLLNINGNFITNLTFSLTIINKTGGLKQKIETLLINHDLKSPSSKSTEMNCIGRIQTLSQNLLIAFVDHNATHAITYISESVTKAINSYPLPSITVGASASDVHIDGIDSRLMSTFLSSLEVSHEVIHFIEYLDHILTSCCVLLSEQPPQVKVTTTDDRIPMNRRATARQSMMGARGTMGGRAEVGLQLDIERLFAQKIKIFDKDAILSVLHTGSILEATIFSVLKAIIKGGHEQSRLQTFSYSAYITIQADVMCIRQLAAALLKDNDTDSLCDQWLSSLFTRYIYANELPTLGDINETAAIGRASNDGFSYAAKNCFLVPR